MKETTSEFEEHLPVDDGQLIDRARAGDEAAFEQLAARYARWVLTIAAGFFRQPDVLEDIAQEVFIKMYQSLGTFNTARPVGPWLRKITLNTCYDHLRQIKRRKELKFSELTEGEAAWLDQLRFDQAMEAFEEEQSKEIAAGLAEKVLQTLSPDDRLALLLYERDGLTTAEIARELEWSRAKVKVRLFRARRALRRTLEHVLGRGAD